MHRYWRISFCFRVLSRFLCIARVFSILVGFVYSIANFCLSVALIWIFKQRNIKCGVYVSLHMYILGLFLVFTCEILGFQLVLSFSLRFSFFMLIPPIYSLELSFFLSVTMLIQNIMSLRGLRDFVVHYVSKWSKNG